MVDPVFVYLQFALSKTVGPRWAPCWPHEPCYQGFTCVIPSFSNELQRARPRCSRLVAYMASPPSDGEQIIITYTIALEQKKGSHNGTEQLSHTRRISSLSQSLYRTWFKYVEQNTNRYGKANNPMWYIYDMPKDVKKSIRKNVITLTS